MSELAETFAKLATNPAYYDTFDYWLRVQALVVDDTDAAIAQRVGEPDREEYRIPLGEESTVRSEYDDRVVEILWGEVIVRLEADHRGPEHGVDGWVGDREDAVPQLIVEDAWTEEIDE